MPYKKLDSAKIEHTIALLHERIAVSLRDRGLVRVCGELHELSRKAGIEAVAIARRNTTPAMDDRDLRRRKS